MVRPKRTKTEPVCYVFSQVGYGSRRSFRNKNVMMMMIIIMIIIIIIIIISNVRPITWHKGTQGE